MSIIDIKKGVQKILEKEFQFQFDVENKLFTSIDDISITSSNDS